METEDSVEDSQAYVKPAWWEIAVFRFLNAIMVVFFLTAVVKLQSDDNSCLWTPTFLVPAFLSTIVAVKPQLSGCKTGSPPDAIQSVIQYKCDRRTLLEMLSHININPINIVSFYPHQICLKHCKKKGLRDSLYYSKLCICVDYQ